MEFIPIILIAAVLIIIFANIKIVPQANEDVVEFLGKYHTTWGAGIHVKVPFVQRVAKRITLKEQVLDSPPQPVITKALAVLDAKSILSAE